MNICICGGGNLGHVTAAYIAARTDHSVSILTRRPQQWADSLTITLPEHGQQLTGKLHGVSSQPETVAANADVVLLCLPAFSIRSELTALRPHIKPQTAVGSIVSNTGFFFQAMELLPKDTPLFGFQRVPFIARITEYGHKAALLGYKKELALAVEQTQRREELRRLAEQLFGTPTTLLRSHYEASLSNSNPLLHPARLYSLWRNWKEGDTTDCVPLFYEQWDYEAASLYITMDQELHELLKLLPVATDSIPTVLDYYESTDATSLAHKLRSITAFKGLTAPMKNTAEGWIPDFQSRYFTEDFAYGLTFIHRLAHEKGVDTPTINTIYEWGMRLIKAHNQ